MKDSDEVDVEKIHDFEGRSLKSMEKIADKNEENDWIDVTQESAICDTIV